MMLQIISFEPTPSPNVMKLQLAQSLKSTERYEYEADQAHTAPAWLQVLLLIKDVKSVYAAADFIALERKNGADWRAILKQVPGIDRQQLEFASFGQPTNAADVKQEEEQSFQVFVQMISDVPMQVKLSGKTGEYRFAMPDEFLRAAVEAGKNKENMIVDRQWNDFGNRYGIANELGILIVEELSAAHRDVLAGNENLITRVDSTMNELPNWQERYAWLSKQSVVPHHLPIFADALRDSHPSVRRLAVVLLGELKQAIAFSYLFKALRDPAISVRRTAGDTLSDLGDSLAIPYMIEALKDEHKLMRWRAARFLYECGDASALSALQIATSDSEFEVALQAKMALERIMKGTNATGTMWQQMTNSSKNVQ